ncbi:MAG: ribonuclease III [Candidatus Obscuribacterales bacterium]|nr:ribonuclease III [Candidatus Obscuribacterales bacterium]
MIFAEGQVEKETAKLIPLKVLAHLGDAVFHLFERERQTLTIKSAAQLHKQAASRVSALKQAELLAELMPQLSEEEADIVRRARNLKVSNYRKSGQDIYRQATAFEALLGYLHLTDESRLLSILHLTLK